jgi:hypothetical protein
LLLQNETSGECEKTTDIPSNSVATGVHFGSHSWSCDRSGLAARTNADETYLWQTPTQSTRERLTPWKTVNHTSSSCLFSNFWKGSITRLSTRMSRGDSCPTETYLLQFSRVDCLRWPRIPKSVALNLPRINSRDATILARGEWVRRHTSGSVWTSNGLAHEGHVILKLQMIVEW